MVTPFRVVDARNWPLFTGGLHPLQEIASGRVSSVCLKAGNRKRQLTMTMSLEAVRVEACFKRRWVEDGPMPEGLLEGNTLLKIATIQQVEAINRLGPTLFLFWLVPR